MPTSESPGRAALRRGWCPTGAVPMAAADGYLLRVRPRGGCLGARDLRNLAGLCRRYGNGAAILTRRAKLELRGIRDTHGALAALRDAGLVPADPAEEALPDRIVSPATDLDPGAVALVAPILDAVERELAGLDAVTRLPPKFALAIDGGGDAHVARVGADLRFEAEPGCGPGRWRVAVGGERADAVTLGGCAGDAVPAVARALIERFLELRAADEGIRRMRHAVTTHGASSLRAAATRWLDECPVAPAQPSRTSVLGHWPGRWYGAAFAFGRLDAETLVALADASERHGDGRLRILATRTVLLGRASAEAAAALRGFGAIESPGDPRLRAETCSGRGGCERGTTPTLADTRALVASAPELLASGRHCVLHVSGCAKGCAHSGRAAVTLTGRDGGYDLSLLGAAGDEPHWRELDRAAAAARLAALERWYLQRRLDDEDPESTLARLGVHWLCERIDEEVAGV